MKTFTNFASAVLALCLLALGPIGIAHAQVKVTAATPASTYQGTVDLDVVVNGSGFDNTSNAQFVVTGTTNPGGITVKKTVFHNSKEIVATIDVADTAVVASFDVVVMLDSGRKGKGTTLFAVQAKVTGNTPPPDPCKTPSPVTEATFPSFIFTRTIELSQNVYATGTFLADATGKCTRLIGTWPGSANFRYNPDTNLALVLTTSGNNIVVGLSSVSFASDGPIATPLSGPTPVLDTTAIPLPPDLTSTGWIFGGPESYRVSPDGSKLLMKLMYATSSGQSTGAGPSLVTCSLTYDADSTIRPIDPATCREVHRYLPGANWHEIAAWGMVPGTIYSTHPSSVDPLLNSLYRVTVQPPPAPSVVEELFYTGGILTGARANFAPPGSAVTNGEIVAVYESAPPGGTRCSKVIVVDAYNCTALSCAVVNQKGMRSTTWLPDGRLAGRGQTPPKKGNGTCLENESFVAYPAIDSNNTPPTVLETTPSLPWNLCRSCIEGSAGGW
jgi:hypothetical protein